MVADNLCNSSEKSLERVEKITGKPVKFYKADILDRDALNEVFDKEEIDSCIHFAGLKAVGESVTKPWEYYENNIAGTLTLVDVMRKHNVKNIIFSSSATIYGDPAEIPITENCPKGQCTNPYGWTKSMLEQILSDIQKADPQWNVVLLRYFNPIGAHKICIRDRTKRLPDTDYRPFDEKKFLNIVGSAVKNVMSGLLSVEEALERAQSMIDSEF